VFQRPDTGHSLEPISTHHILISNNTTLPPIPAHAGSSLVNFSTLNMEAIRCTDTSVHTRTTLRHIPENGILHSHRRGNLKSYIELTS
jgi:hypothetical protein